MKQWTDLVTSVINAGELRQDRTGVGTLAVFGGHMRFDLRERFPLLQLKETRWKVAFLEMLFFIGGHTNAKWMEERGSKLWTAWADADGELGPVYGSQWRRWGRWGRWGLGCIDQVKVLIEGIKANPMGRRHIVSAWNVDDLPGMALPPCHWAHQAYASDDGHLDLMVHQRSWDLALGAPFNIAQYALLLTLYARATGRQPRYLHFTYGDAHVYLNHVDALRRLIDDMHEALQRPAGFAPSWAKRDKARLVIKTDNVDIDGYKLEDFDIEGYEPGPFIKLEVAV